MKNSLTLFAVIIYSLTFNPVAVADPTGKNDGGVFSLINDVSNEVDELETRIDDLEANTPGSEPVYNYRDYVAPTTVSTRTYDFYDTKFSLQKGCRTEVHQINRVPNADGSKGIFITRTRSNSNNGFICNQRTYDYLATAEAFIFNGYTNQLSSYYDLSFNSPFTNRTSSMKVGDSWAHATGTVKTGIYRTHTFRENTFVAVEDVNTPYQNYSACLKMHTKQRSVVASSYDAIEWYCQGVGLVKRVLVFNDGTRSLRIKLTGIN